MYSFTEISTVFTCENRHDLCRNPLTRQVAKLQGLELAAPLLGPALDNHFRLRKELYSMVALSVQVSKEAIFPAAEGKKRHRGRYADVNADVASFSFVTKLASCCATVRKQTGHIAPGTMVD